MAEAKPIPVLTPKGLEPIPYVVVRRPDGTLVLRHPDELKPVKEVPRG